MSEVTRKPLFSFEQVEEELAKQREQIAREIEATVSGSCPNLDCNCYVVAARIARGEK